MKRTPLTRKTPLRSHYQTRPKNGEVSGLLPKREKRMRQSRTTTTPTKAERAHLEAIKQPGRCVACRINARRGLRRADARGCDAHHTLTGGRRRGHMQTLGLCPWHHRGICPGKYTSDAAAESELGPSLAHGAKPFRAFYGTDDELLAAQENER